MIIFIFSSIANVTHAETEHTQDCQNIINDCSAQNAKKSTWRQDMTNCYTAHTECQDTIVKSPTVVPCVQTDKDGRKADGTSLTPGQVKCEDLPDLPSSVYGIFDITKSCPGKFVRDPGKDELLCVIKSIIQLILSGVGALMVVVIIISGLMFITSAGNPTNLERAKKTLVGVVIGLIIIVMSYAIVTILGKII